MLNTKSNSGQCSFCVPQQAVTNLITSRASAGVICTYLVIAAHTESTGTRSTAGIKAIIGRLGCRRELAERHILKLTELGLISRILTEDNTFPLKPSEPRFHVYDFDEEISNRVWIGKSLVDFVEKKSKKHLQQKEVFATETRWTPIRSLYSQNSIYIALLLWLYAAYDANWLAVRPGSIYSKYGAFVRYEEFKDQNYAFDDHSVKVYGNPEPVLMGSLLTENYSYDDLIIAMNELQKLSFIYEVIMVFDRKLESDPLTSGESFLPIDALPQYHLHARSNKNLLLPADEKGVSNLTLEIAKCHDGMLDIFCRESGKFNGFFALVNKPLFDAEVVGMYRLRHRVRNVKNKGVAQPWAVLMENERDYRAWLEQLALDEYELNLSTFKQSAAFELKSRKIHNKLNSAA